jgi:curved DNA-binding protein CbpA
MTNTMTDRINQQDYYRLLDVSRHASQDEIAAAYDRLRVLYQPERLQDGPPEFQALAAQKREQFATAYEVLSDPERRAAYDRETQGDALQQVEVIDYRPLPPARGQERMLGGTSTVERPRSSQPRRPSLLRRWIVPIVVALGGLALSGLLVLSNVRVVDGSTALATPSIPDLTLPFTPAQIDQFRSAALSTDSAEAWTAFGNALFNNLQMLRENAPLSPQYRGQLDSWLEVVAAYDRSLALEENEVVRSDRALSLYNYGTDAPNEARMREAVEATEQALQRDITESRALINYGSILISTDLDRHNEVFALWRKAQTIAPGSPDAQRAQALLQMYGQE